MSANAPLLLDTCAAIFLTEGTPLSTEARDALATSRAAGNPVFVSPFTAWEYATLVAKKRLRSTITPDAWFATLLSFPNFTLAPLTAEILIASTRLPGTPPRDPADRIIAATARAGGLTVVTRDGELLPYAAAGHLAAVRC
ncbi:type II toxin-antitoxin system VapC family toxin [Lichenibacterium dinghuense]|uniref:type II toxin-antitoxin system VapC family toxin n=1 Tax=Lichenibacterium dinghuense TaxID=2895977 RepID=UPI001F2739E9|nr:type II toxin-antitoxin system VapC family toxin [Lichenibacterium sp. 6Y81]